MLSDILKRQLVGEDHLPKYNYHVTESIVSLDDGRVMFTVKTSGLPFDLISDNQLDSNYDGLNSMFLAIAKGTGSRLSCWSHVDHYETKFDTQYEFGYQWLRDFTNAYMKRFYENPILQNDFYLTFLLKPNQNDTLEDTIKELEEIQLTVIQSLRNYECELLKMYENENGLFSEAYEFMGYLYNGVWEKIPVTSLPMFQTVQSSFLHHSYKLIETRFADGGNRFSCFYDLKDFPEPTKKGRLNGVLSLPFPFLLCHSFTVLYSSDSIRLINQTINKMESAGDEAVSQVVDLEEGKGGIMSGDICFGEYHSALIVHGRTEKECEHRGGTTRTTLQTSCNTMFTAATMSAPETFFSIFPGNTKKRPRPMPKTTRNFTGMFSMNTYSSGKQYGNPIGDGKAVIPLATDAKGVYHFNFHYSNPDDDSIGEKKAGHTLIHGATGAGKTTLQATLIAFLERYNAKLFGIDKDGSMRGMIEGLGGTYFNIRSGEPTGLNPFQLPDEPINRSFLYDLVTSCGRRNIEDKLSAEDNKDVKKAVDNVFSQPFESRRFSVLLQSIPDRGPDCLRRRLLDWCYDEEDGDGRLAYALDNPRNLFDWETFWRIGFDVTDFLKKDHPATEPILAYLFHLKTLMQRKGGLLATVIEEYWLPASYPTTQNQILDILKTGRRRDEFGVLVSQSPEDAIKLEILPDILQQCPTKIYLANPEAEYENKSGGGYVRFGLSKKEFAKLKDIKTTDFKFLVKQANQASVVKLDLSGEPIKYVSVLAMALDEFPILEEAKRQAGNHPDKWVPLYIDLRREARKAKLAKKQESKNVMA